MWTDPTQILRKQNKKETAAAGCTCVLTYGTVVFV